MWVKYGFSTLYAVNLKREEGIIPVESAEKLRPVESTSCTQRGSQRTTVSGGEQRLPGEYPHGIKLTPSAKSNSAGVGPL